MTESSILSESDLALIDALQVAPRAPWATVGKVLGVSAVGAARRWSRLVGSGMAWVTAAPGMALHNEQCLAYVEITCAPEHRLAVAHAIAQHSLAVTVELITGSADLLVTVAAIDLRMLSHYLLHHLDKVEHVLSSRARIATRIYGEGSMWRLRVLDAGSVQTLHAVRDQQMADDETACPVKPSPVVQTMLTHLANDGRASFVDLAEHAGISPSSARRHMGRLLRSGVIILRTDVNAPAVNWPVQVYLWAKAPADKLAETATVLSRFRHTRLTATVTAHASLALCLWLRTTEDVHRFEMTIATELPHVEIVDRLVVLAQMKRMGRLLDESGRAVGVVPINFWDDLLPHAGTDVAAHETGPTPRFR